MRTPSIPAVGIDWGTSTSSVARFDGVQTEILMLPGESSTRMPSTLWLPKEPVFDAPVDEVGRALALAPGLIEHGAAAFGSAATDQLLAGADHGFYVKSPKSWLGAELKPRQIENFTALVARMLGHLLDRAADVLGVRPERAVIGRPVRYHGRRGDDGNRQALAIMEQAAHQAGLREFEFLLEPVAAARAYERSLPQSRRIMVVDVGGGTTDLTLMQLGPDRIAVEDRRDDVLATAGVRHGGTDVDSALAFQTLSAQLGREVPLPEGRPLPNHYFVDLCTIADVNAQARFASEATRTALERWLANCADAHPARRLRTIQARSGSYRFNRDAEQTKVRLTEHERVSVDLSWVEEEFAVDVSREQLAVACERLIEEIGDLAREIRATAGAQEDEVFVTGGTALSPVIAAGIRRALGASRIVVGDLFGSVASGLAVAAHR